jgi:hypothetical protein
VTIPPLLTIDDAEEALIKALTAADIEPLRSLLHPQFIAVHSPVGLIQDAEQFLANTAARPATERVEVIDPIVRHFSDTVTVSCIQEMRIRMVPDLPSFVIQAAVSRVWVREGGSWQLAHLQLARRFPPG